MIAFALAEITPSPNDPKHQMRSTVVAPIKGA